MKKGTVYVYKPNMCMKDRHTEACPEQDLVNHRLLHSASRAKYVVLSLVGTRRAYWSIVEYVKSVLTLAGRE
jgi:hypothetical protein